MADVGDFFLGVIIVGAAFTIGFVPGLNILSPLLYAYGTKKIIDGIFGGQEIASVIRGIQFNALSSQASIPVVYGQFRVGLKINDTRLVDSAIDTSADPDAIFSGADDRDILARVGALCVGSEDGSGVESISFVEFYADPTSMIAGTLLINTALTNSNVRSSHTGVLKYHAQLGTDAQQNHLDLRDNLGWNTAMDGRGLAYVAFFMLFDVDLWRGIPGITALVKGNKLYDPRTSLFEFPNYATRTGANPALVILDYLTSKRYGGGVPYAARDGGSLDFIDEQSFIDAANYCEQQVSIPPSGTEDRFGFNGAVNTARRVGENLADMLATCRGQLIWQGGKFKVIIGKVTTAETFELTEDNILSIEFVRKGADIPNSIQAAFVRNGTVEDTVIWPLVGDTTLLDEDNGMENRVEVVLPFTTGRNQAIRTVMVLLKEARQDVFANIVSTQAAMQLETGNVVRVTHEGPGWVQQEMVVRLMSLSADGKVEVSLQKYDAAAYSLDSLTAEPATPTTSLPDPFTVDPPTGINFTADETTATVTKEGVITPRGLLDWTASPDPFLRRYEVQFQQNAAMDSWRQAAPDPQKGDLSVYLLGLEEDKAFDIRIRAVSTVGAVSPYVTLTNQLIESLDSSRFYPPFSDLEWYGSFNEGSGLTLRDRSLHGRDAVPPASGGGAAITWVRGVEGWAVHFPGGGIGYQLLTDAEAGAIEGLFYATCWIKVGVPLSGDTAARIISRDASDYFGIQLNQSTVMPQDIIFSYSDTQSTTLVDAITNQGQWYFLLAQWDVANTTVEFWLGSEATGLLTRLFRSESLAAFATSSRPIGIGSNVETTVQSGNAFEGDIDDVRIGAPPALLTHAQILSMFRDPGVGAPQGSVVPTWATELDRDAQGNATLRLTIDDPSNSIISPGPRFAKRDGSQAGEVWGSLLSVWDTEPGNPPYSGLWEELLVLPGGEEAGIRWEYDWVDEEGVTRKHSHTHYTSSLDENQVELIFPFSGGRPLNDSFDNEYVLGIGGELTPKNADDPLTWILPITAPIGVTIEEFEARLFKDGVADICIANLRKGSIDGAPSLLAALTASTGGWSTQSNTSVSETVEADRTYHVEAVFAGFDFNDDARGAWSRIVYLRHTQEEVY